MLLVDGRMVLSADGRELLRVEGRLSKNPSFWTSLVNIIRHYARVDGIRVPIAIESIARVKFAGVCPSTCITSTRRSTAVRSASRHGAPCLRSRCGSRPRESQNNLLV